MFGYKKALNFISGNEGTHNQIQKEIEWFLNSHGPLEPKMYISYERHSYTAVEDRALRITLDSHILYRTYDFDLRKGVYGRDMLEDGAHILEIKTEAAIPLWLCRIMNALEIYPTSFSKYGTAYKQMLKEEIA